MDDKGWWRVGADRDAELPANNTTRTAPATVNLSATASETGGTISKVEFYRDTTLVATVTTGNGGLYTDSDNVPVGTYNYTAKAYDANNVTTTSAAASVVVNSGTSINVAAQANGGAASAWSTYSSAFPVTAVNDGDRKGLNWGNGGG